MRIEDIDNHLAELEKCLETLRIINKNSNLNYEEVFTEVPIRFLPVSTISDVASTNRMMMVMYADNDDFKLAFKIVFEIVAFLHVAMSELKKATTSDASFKIRTDSEEELIASTQMAITITEILKSKFNKKNASEGKQTIDLTPSQKQSDESELATLNAKLDEQIQASVARRQRKPKPGIPDFTPPNTDATASAIDINYVVSKAKDKNKDEDKDKDKKKKQKHRKKKTLTPEYIELDVDDDNEAAKPSATKPPLLLHQNPGKWEPTAAAGTMFTPAPIQNKDGATSATTSTPTRPPRQPISVVDLNSPYLKWESSTSTEPQQTAATNAATNTAPAPTINHVVKVNRPNNNYSTDYKNQHLNQPWADWSFPPSKATQPQTSVQTTSPSNQSTNAAAAVPQHFSNPTTASAAMPSIPPVQTVSLEAPKAKDNKKIAFVAELKKLWNQDSQRAIKIKRTNIDELDRLVDAAASDSSDTNLKQLLEKTYAWLIQPKTAASQSSYFLAVRTLHSRLENQLHLDDKTCQAHLDTLIARIKIFVIDHSGGTSTGIKKLQELIDTTKQLQNPSAHDKAVANLNLFRAFQKEAAIRLATHGSRQPEIKTFYEKLRDAKLTDPAFLVAFVDFLVAENSKQNNSVPGPTK